MVKILKPKKSKIVLPEIFGETQEALDSLYALRTFLLLTVTDEEKKKEILAKFWKTQQTNLGEKND